MLKKPFTYVLSFLLAGAFVLYSPTSAQAVEATCPTLSEAQAAMVIDEQGNVIYSLNPDAELNMASITKIMTAVVALENGYDFSSSITCKGSTLDENAQVAGYKEGNVVSAYDLFLAMLVYSANDAAYEIACSVAGSEEAFVALMNAKAAELGMAHTHFANSHGLDADGHYSSVSDLVLLARYAMTNYSAISDAVTKDVITVPIDGAETTLESTDTFITSYQGALGIKTGKGNDVTCFLGAARRNGLTLYSCVLGCTSNEGRFTDTITLMDAAFSTYEARVYSDASVSYTTPFAFHFGKSVQVIGEGNIAGYVDRGASIKSTRLTTYKSTDFLEPNKTIALEQWVQGEREVATVVYASSPTLVQSRSGLGLVGKILEAAA